MAWTVFFAATVFQTNWRSICRYSLVLADSPPPHGLTLSSVGGTKFASRKGQIIPSVQQKYHWPHRLYQDCRCHCDALALQLTSVSTILYSWAVLVQSFYCRNRNGGSVTDGQDSGLYYSPFFPPFFCKRLFGLVRKHYFTRYFYFSKNRNILKK